jgi:hypothetical protein
MSAARRFLLTVLCAVMALGTPLTFAAAATLDAGDAAMQAMSHEGDGCDCCSLDQAAKCAQHCAAAFGSALPQLPSAVPGGAVAEPASTQRAVAFSSRSGPPTLQPPR